VADIAFISGKGGSTKTSTVFSLGTRSATSKSKTALIDLDLGQASLSALWTLAGRPGNPYLYNDPGVLLPDRLAILKESGFKHVLMDTAPFDPDSMAVAVLSSDIVIIPVRPAFLDTAAIDAAVDLCKRHKKPYAFLFGAYDDRKKFARTNAEARAMLADRGKILPTYIPYDVAFLKGQMVGKAAQQIDKKLDPIIGKVWTEIMQTLKEGANV